MPRTSASGDDVVGGTNRPFHHSGPIKGDWATLPASSSNVDNAGNAGKQAVIVRPTRKFGTKKLAIKWIPT
jgi:hypothetical protein